MAARAGECDQLLIFEAPQTSEDDFGGGAVEWVEQGRVWAKVVPVSAREGERQGAERERSALARLAAEIDLLEPLIVSAERQAGHEARFAFDYDAPRALD